MSLLGREDDGDHTVGGRYHCRAADSSESSEDEERVFLDDEGEGEIDDADDQEADTEYQSGVVEIDDPSHQK